MVHALQAKHIAKHFLAGGSASQPLIDASLRLETGQFTALVGRSGSGKSTLLNILAGLELPDDGEVFVEETSLWKVPEDERAALRLKRIGLVFQFFNLLPSLTIAQNVQVPGRLAGKRASECEKRCTALLTELGIAPLADKFPSQVSGGEIQRAAICRALFNQPTVLLADEPTGNLDPTSADRVITSFRDVARNQGVAVLVVTHDDQLVDAADRVIRLESGKIT